MDESLYRRGDDLKWRDRTEERIVNLQNGDATQNDRIDDLEEEVRGVHEILEGKPSDKDDNGIKGDIKELNRGLNALRAIMAPDSLGQGGVINRLKAVERQVGLEEKSSDNRWTFATQVAGATVAAIAAITVALIAIEPVRNAIGHYLESHFSTQNSQQNSKTSSKRSGHKKSRRSFVPAAVDVPKELTTDDAGKSELSTGRDADGGDSR